jgi:light-regulated signal transduction histidine kinase (bacteriophytochrome)
MARHFLGLYLLIAGTLAAVSWAQDALLQLYTRPNSMDDAPVALAVSIVKDRLRDLPEARWNGEVKQGFGLGLAIVKRVVEWHNGSVFVDESPMGGARFMATWPANTS